MFESQVSANKGSFGARLAIVLVLEFKKERSNGEVCEFTDREAIPQSLGIGMRGGYSSFGQIEAKAPKVTIHSKFKDRTSFAFANAPGKELQCCKNFESLEQTDIVSSSAEHPKTHCFSMEIVQYLRPMATLGTVVLDLGRIRLRKGFRRVQQSKSLCE